MRLLDRNLTEVGRPGVERFVAEEVICDTLAAFDGQRVQCVRRLVSLPLPQPYTNLLCEVLMGQMLALPQPRLPLMAYCTVMVDLCKVGGEGGGGDAGEAASNWEHVAQPCRHSSYSSPHSCHPISIPSHTPQHIPQHMPSHTPSHTPCPHTSPHTHTALTHPLTHTSPPHSPSTPSPQLPRLEFPKPLSGCVRECFARVGVMDPELRGRLVGWLSYHLSNFEYQWPWGR